MFKVFKFFSPLLNSFNLFSFLKCFFGFNYFIFYFLCVFSGISLSLGFSLKRFSSFVKRCLNTVAFVYDAFFVIDLKSDLVRVQKNLKNVRILRTFLFVNFLPCNGQRTKTNAKTSKKRNKKKVKK